MQLEQADEELIEEHKVHPLQLKFFKYSDCESLRNSIDNL